MNQVWTELHKSLPPAAQELIALVAPFAQVILIAVVALVLRYLMRKIITRTGAHYALPIEIIVGGRRVASFVILSGAALLILERLGVSGTMLWSAFTGFAAVAAVAFFAAWSVLSNIFCSILIFTTRLFRLHDHIELLENGEKPGLKGRVIDINLIYTTLEETGTHAQGTEVKVPNALFFQRTVRRWVGPLGSDALVAAKPYQTPAAAPTQALIPSAPAGETVAAHPPSSAPTDETLRPAAG